MGVAGMTLVFAVPLLAPDRSGESLGVPEMGWFIIVAIPIAVLAGALWIREPVTHSETTDRVVLTDYKELILHPSMLRIVLAMLLFTLGTAWEGALFLFYFTDGRAFSVPEASMLLIVALGGGLLGAPAIGKLSTKIGKHGGVVMTAVAYTAALASLALIPVDAKLLACVPVICTGFLYAGFHVLLRSMTADVADEIRLTHHKERGALLYALITLAPKLSAAIAVGLAFNALALLGYDPSAGEGNASGTIAGLSSAYLLGPICFVAMGAACMTGYKLGPARTAEIQKLLEDRMRTSVNSPVSTN
jgi:Na+/melibiose symporter-like transporter